MGAVTQHKAIVSRFFDALNRGDVDTMVNTSPGKPTVTSSTCYSSF